MRPRARATDSPSEVLPTPGRADQGQDGARAPAVDRGRGRARPAACARPGARGCAPSRRSSPSWSSSRIRAASATSRRSSDSTPHGSSRTVSSQVRIHPCSGLCSLVRSSLSISRIDARRAPARAGRAGLDLGAVVVGVGRRRRRSSSPELLADGLELAAQEELALGPLHALLDVGLDPLAQGQVGQGVAGPAEHQAQPGLDVERSRAPRPSGPGSDRASSRRRRPAGPAR